MNSNQFDTDALKDDSNRSSIHNLLSGDTLPSEPEKPTFVDTSCETVEVEGHRDGENLNQIHGVAKEQSTSQDDIFHKNIVDDNFTINEETSGDFHLSKNVNILLLGETGVGKSTWINAIANYMRFEHFDEAIKNMRDMTALIPCSFSFRDRNQSYQIKFGEDDSNEVLEPGQSATQGCKTYSFPHGNFKINLIDTPGVGDVGGIGVDKKNFAHILTYLKSYDE